MTSATSTPSFLARINDREEALAPKTYMLNKKRTLYLSDVVDGEMAFNAISAISFLSDRSKEDITIMINSPGGSVSDGLAIMDAMQACGCNITTIATGMAASMGAFLLAAGTQGKRYATKSAKILLHQPLGGVQGQVSDILIAAENISKTKLQISSHLANFTGQTLDKINADLDRDLWLTANEALAYGIIDGIKQ